MHFSHTLSINRPVAEVAAWLGDIKNDRLWQEDVVESGFTTGGPAAVGSEGYEVRTILGLPQRSRWVITAMDPETGFSFSSIEASIPYTGSVHLEPEGTRTRLTYSFSLHPEGPLSLLSPLLEPLVSWRFKADLNNLVRILEQEPQ